MGKGPTKAELAADAAAKVDGAVAVLQKALDAEPQSKEELTEAQKAADAVVEEAEASRNADAKLKAAGVPAGETEIPRARLLERLEERRVRRRRSGPDRGRGGSARA